MKVPEQAETSHAQTIHQTIDLFAHRKFSVGSLNPQDIHSQHVGG